MKRVTVTIDEALISALDQYMATAGHDNRSQAVRDLVRAGLLKESKTGDGARPCIAALTYVYNHETRQLSRELLRDHHHHVDMSIAVLHVHLDERSCLEVSMLRGQKSRVEQFARRYTVLKVNSHAFLARSAAGKVSTLVDEKKSIATTFTNTIST